MAGRAGLPAVRCTGWSLITRPGSARRSRVPGVHEDLDRGRRTSPPVQLRRAGSYRYHHSYGGATRAWSVGRYPARGQARDRFAPDTAYSGYRTARRSPAANGCAA